MSGSVCKLLRKAAVVAAVADIEQERSRSKVLRFKLRGTLRDEIIAKAARRYYSKAKRMWNRTPRPDRFTIGTILARSITTGVARTGLLTRQG